MAVAHTVHGLFGLLKYESYPDGSLGVPFQSGTFEIKEEIKKLGFRCAYEERVWLLEGATAQDEAALCRLLETGSPDAPEPPPARPAGGVAAQGAPTSPMGTPAQRAERRRKREEDEPQAGARQPRLFFGGAVALQRQPDGHVTLEGGALLSIWQQLERIFHFERVSLRITPCWRSSFPLNDREVAFLEELLVHREDKLMVDPGMDDKDPLPSGTQLPARFRPLGSDGVVMRGPYTVRPGGNGKPWNYGRQFFSNNDGGFIWADGTYPFDTEAQGRFRHFAPDHMDEVLEAAERDPNLMIMRMPLPFLMGGADGCCDECDHGSHDEEDGEEEERGSDEDWEEEEDDDDEDEEDENDDDDDDDFDE
ncbi:hypothetical protein ABPG77_004974 [Micractinium sp. CCAP 211/92]